MENGSPGCEKEGLVMLKPIRRSVLAGLIAAGSITALLLFTLSRCVLACAVPELTGPYLGQAPPGSTPRIFAPGIVSTWAGFEHSAGVFSPDGQKLFWCTNIDMRTNPPGEGQRLYFMQEVDGAWTAPEAAPFTVDISGPQRPVFSPDGARLYFEGFSSPSTMDNVDIYVVEREGDGWSAPALVSREINTGAIERLHCVTSDGSLIFSRDPYTRREKIYISRFVDGAFAEPEELGEPFDSAAHELAIVIAPDESYMLIGVTRTGFEDELYVCYRNADGSWTERIRAPYECGGFLALSPGGEYMFFLGEGIYWVDTSFVEELRPTRESERD
jgi:hypothetical protein